jgi:hypothetical protein
LFREAINVANLAGKIAEGERSDLLTQPHPSRIHICGYFNGVPAMAFWDIVFGEKWSVNPTRRSDQIGRTDSGRASLYGSSVVRTLLMSGTPHPGFGEFRNDADLAVYRGLDAPIEVAIGCAYRYIEACGSRTARLLDPKACEHIGGFTAIATITRNKGFEWVEGRTPKN